MVTLMAVVKRQPSSRRMTPRPVYEPKMFGHVAGGGGVGVGRGSGVGSGVGVGLGSGVGVGVGVGVGSGRGVTTGSRVAGRGIRGATARGDHPPPATAAAAPPPTRIVLVELDEPLACRPGGGSGRRHVLAAPLAPARPRPSPPATPASASRRRRAWSLSLRRSVFRAPASRAASAPRTSRGPRPRRGCLPRLAAHHHEARAVGVDVVVHVARAADGRAIRVRVERDRTALAWRAARPQREASARHLAVRAAVDLLPTARAPQRLIAAPDRSLRLAVQLGKLQYIDLEAPLFVGGVGKPAAVRREARIAFLVEPSQQRPASPPATGRARRPAPWTRPPASPAARFRPGTSRGGGRGGRCSRAPLRRRFRPREAAHLTRPPERCVAHARQPCPRPDGRLVLTSVNVAA